MVACRFESASAKNGSDLVAMAMTCTGEESRTETMLVVLGLRLSERGSDAELPCVAKERHTGDRVESAVSERGSFSWSASKTMPLGRGMSPFIVGKCPSWLGR